MPRADYEALEAKRRARRGRGVDSDEETVVDTNTEDDNSGEKNNDPDPEDERSIEETIESLVRHTTIAMFRRILIFSDGAAASLYDDQMITTFDVLRELDDDTIKEICRAIKKPGGAATGYQISETTYSSTSSGLLYQAERSFRNVNIDPSYASVIEEQDQKIKHLQQ